MERGVEEGIGGGVLGGREGEVNHLCTEAVLCFDNMNRFLSGYHSSAVNLYRLVVV